jgi:hypothetical protein
MSLEREEVLTFSTYPLAVSGLTGRLQSARNPEDVPPLPRVPESYTIRRATTRSGGLEEAWKPACATPWGCSRVPGL